MRRLALLSSLLAALCTCARADDALDRGLKLLRGERRLRPELLGEDVYRVEVDGTSVGYFRTVTTEDEVQGKPAYRVRGQSLSAFGGQEERMEYLYLAYPDFTPVHYQRSRFAPGRAGGEAPDTYLLLLEADRFKIRKAQGEPLETPYESGLVGFDLVTHLARLVPPDASEPIAFRMLDEGGTIRRVEFRVEDAERIQVGETEVETRRLVHTGLATPAGTPLEFRFWRDAEGSIVRFEGVFGKGATIRFESMPVEEWIRVYGSPIDAVVDYLLALAAGDRTSLERRIDFRESYVLSISKNEMNRNLSGEDLERLWGLAAETYPGVALGSLLAQPVPYAPARDATAPEIRGRLEALETSSGERAVVLYQPTAGDPVYFYLRRGGSGWQVAYVTREK